MYFFSRHLSIGTYLLTGLFFVLIFCFVLLFEVNPVSAQTSCPNFVIEGFGRNTTGGCGGTLYMVSSLADSGPGTLREFVENRSGPRIIKFGVAGSIRLSNILTIESPYVTLDGSDAPSPGIEITGREVNVGTHDVILRFIRFRGPLPSGEDSLALVGYDRDLPSPHIPYNVVVDHVSMSGGMDGTIDIANEAHDISFQWSILSDNNGSGLNLISYGVKNITMHHNLYAHSIARFPEVGAGDLDIVNNVMYNWHAYGRTALHGYANPIRANIVGNYYKPGVMSTTLPSYSREIRLGSGSAVYSTAAYVFGNISPNRPNDSLPQDANVYFDNSVSHPLESLTQARFNFPQVTTTSAFQAYDQVLANAGARLPCLDMTDSRVISDVTNGTGNRVLSWPVLSCSSGSTPSLPGDLNSDRIVNSLDWSLMSAKWLTSDTNADLNKDGAVNSLDWSVMSSNWLKTQ